MITINGSRPKPKLRKEELTEGSAYAIYDSNALPCLIIKNGNGVVEVTVNGIRFVKMCDVRSDKAFVPVAFNMAIDIIPNQ